MRINKYLSEIGHCSRREADRLIGEGRVTINGRVPEVGAQVGRRDKVKVDGRLVSTEQVEEDIYLAFNKPVGIVSTTDTEGEPDNIIDYVNHPRRIFPVGRLDKQSEGLILLTSDGDIVNKILRASNHHEKEYEVKVDKPITPDFLAKMANGVPILGVVTRKCRVVQLGTFSFSIVLTQGLNRQIRRMCEYLGYEVVALRRVRIMHIRLDIPLGDWRDLTEGELEALHKAVAGSAKEAPPPKPKKKNAFKILAPFPKAKTGQRAQAKRTGGAKTKPAGRNRNSPKPGGKKGRRR